MIYPDAYSRPVTGVTGTVDETTNSSCATDVSYAVVGNVYWSASDCHQPSEEGVCGAPLCDDGFPPVTGDYTSCDRPNLKQCQDGAFVPADTGICNRVCTDYDTCYQYSLNANSCEGASYFEFTYTNPENWSFVCTTILDSSPDHADNGGNQDGNENNDPSSPDTPNSSDVDVDTLASAIGSALQDDFGNIERAIRDNTDADKDNTSDVVNSINDFSNQNQQGLSEVESAIRDGTSSAQSDAKGISDSVASLSAQIGNLSNELGNDGPCDPTQSDYYSCLDTPTNALPSHSDSAGTFEAVNNTFFSRIDNAPLASAFRSIGSLLNFDNATCPAFSFDLPAPINRNISTNIHCDLYDSVSAVISTVMIIVWTFLGFRIFASA